MCNELVALRQGHTGKRRALVSHMMQRQEAEPEEVGLTFNDVFSLRRPRDAKAGLASGLKSAGKGLVTGLMDSFA